MAQRLFVTLAIACSLAGLSAVGCGDQVARETGTIQGQLPWSGTWPEEGAMLVVLFDVPPWDPDFVPGAPAAFTIVAAPAGEEPAPFSMASPGVSFGSYGALTAAWQDPAADSQAEHMRPVAVWGTSLDRPDLSSPVELTERDPDLEMSFDAVELFSSSADMRSHYPPVSD